MKCIQEEKPVIALRNHDYDLGTLKESCALYFVKLFVDGDYIRILEQVVKL